MQAGRVEEIPAPKATLVRHLVVVVRSDDEAKNALGAYFAGAKRLWSDLAVWRAARKARGTRALTWRERDRSDVTPWHFLRMCPLLVNPLPPPFGFVLIFIASTAPRRLLTPEFWTLQQCERFARADGDAARRRYAKLLAECERANPGPSLAESPSPRAPAAPPQSTSGVALAADEVACAEQLACEQFAQTFARLLASMVDAFEGPLALERLSREHLVRLARATRRPLRRWTLRFLAFRPKKLREMLARAACIASADDDALSLALSCTEPCELTTRELFDVCSQRGLRLDGDDETRAKRLSHWLDARSALLVSRGGAPLPPSLVLHLPALFSALQEKVPL